MVAKILTKLAKEALRKVGKNRKKLTAKEKAEGPLGDTKLKPKKKLSKKKQAERRAQNLAAAEKKRRRHRKKSWYWISGYRSYRWRYCWRVFR